MSEKFPTGSISDISFDDAWKKKIKEGQVVTDSMIKSAKLKKLQEDRRSGGVNPNN